MPEPTSVSSTRLRQARLRPFLRALLPLLLAANAHADGIDPADMAGIDAVPTPLLSVEAPAVLMQPPAFGSETPTVPAPSPSFVAEAAAVPVQPPAFFAEGTAARAPVPPSPPPAPAPVTQLLLPVAAPVLASAPESSAVYGYIEPERTVTAPISNRDVNRVHCSVPVDDVFYSKEKPVSITPAGNDVYVKVLKKVLGEREEFVTLPIDLHVVCGGEVYTMILQPQEMDAVTLRLGNPVKAKAGAIAKEWGSLPIEDKVQRLTRLVYRDELPATFQRSNVLDDRRYVRFWRNIRLRAVQRVTAQGLGLAAVEYEVVALEPVTLHERDFLNTDLSKSIVGVTVDPLTLSEAGKRARLIIIERSVSDGR